MPVTEKTYYTIQTVGKCLCCGSIADLRCGACWGCSSHVKGRPLSDGGHELTATKHSKKTWRVRADLTVDDGFVQ